MKTSFKSIRLFTAALSTAIGIASAPPAHAGLPGDLTLNVTNAITAATSIIGAPTNAPDTNGLCWGTGSWVSLADFDRCTLIFRGHNSVTNIGNCVVSLVRSDKLPPLVATDFETAAQANMIFTIPMNGTTDGCLILTNTASAGYITNELNQNSILSISTKTIPNTFTKTLPNH